MHIKSSFYINYFLPSDVKIKNILAHKLLVLVLNITSHYFCSYNYHTVLVILDCIISFTNCKLPQRFTTTTYTKCISSHRQIKFSHKLFLGTSSKRVINDAFLFSLALICMMSYYHDIRLNEQ